MTQKVGYKIDSDANLLMTRTKVWKNVFIPKVVKIVDENIIPFYTYKRMLVREAKKAGHQVPENLKEKDYYDVPILTDKLVTYERRLCLRKRRGTPSKTRLIDVPVEMAYVARNPFFFINENNRKLQEVIYENIGDWMSSDQKDNKFNPEVLVFLDVKEYPTSYEVVAKGIFYIQEYTYEKIIFSDSHDKFYEMELTPELLRLGRTHSFVLFFPSNVSLVY